MYPVNVSFFAKIYYFLVMENTNTDMAFKGKNYREGFGVTTSVGARGY
jgi:hypothetical protein